MIEKAKLTVFGRTIDAVTAAMSLAGALACLCVVVLVNLDIILRFSFSAPMEGVPEIVALSIVGISFLQLPGCVIGEAMTRSDLFVLTMRKRHPPFGRALDAATCLLGIIPVAVIAWRAFPRTIDEYLAHEYVGTMGLFTFPAWPITLFIAIGSLFGCLQLVRLALRALRPTDADALDIVEAEVLKLERRG